MLARKTPSPTAETSPAVAEAPEAGTSNAVEASGEVGAQHDTPTHIGIGDSVDGASIEAHGVYFTPGEAAALVDFVGPLTNLEKEFTAEQLLDMKGLIQAGIEDSEAWDEATGGQYTELAQDNEDHFGSLVGPTFLRYLAAAIAAAQEAQSHEEG